MTEELDTLGSLPEDQVDTTPEPTDTDQITTPEPAAEQLVVEPEPQLPPETPPLTQEQLIAQAEQRAFDRMASWQGRRDHDLFNKIGDLIETKVKATVQPTQTPEPVDFLENPDGWFERKLSTAAPNILYEAQAKQAQKAQQFSNDVVRHAGDLMNKDPLFEDKELGAEVVKEIQSQFGSIDQNLNPETGAQLLVNKAVAEVYRKQRAAKINPLQNNQPSTQPMGTIKPPAAQQQPVQKIKLSAEARKLQKRFGYTDEEVSTLFNG